MQEEVEQRVVTLAINCTKLTEQELKKALVKLLQHWKTHQQKGPHGKMTVKQLAAQNRGLQSVEVTDQNIGSFKKIARKYGIDFAPYKAKGQDQGQECQEIPAQPGVRFCPLGHCCRHCPLCRSGF